MLAFRPHYLILVVVLLSLASLSSACDTLKPIAFDKEILRFVKTLEAIYVDLKELKDMKKDKNVPKTVLDVAMKGYCQLVTLNYSRGQIMSVALPFVGVSPKSIVKAFTMLDKTYQEFNKKDALAAVDSAESFAVGMIKSIDGIKKYTDKLRKAKIDTKKILHL
ncbi:uncharacterized protein MELLADRAFT_64940 [Melampsora larici-populina 98AG31]|uniref:Secreted protein n=1 Tax=Melampsora larici-populina (strain 98AG31 / pathotype 3-4-7) TaxID=747676 RepID=F4RTC7_MELLP|nr:uncharacterized protein MELLADRAFT_64940 [Melampsora larici-populina 98AG31]EGG04366.1 hypothetical protein MELLADRAFT_64940 [Melampsora larici-populina 98AG31]